MRCQIPLTCQVTDVRGSNILMFYLLFQNVEVTWLAHSRQNIEALNGMSCCHLTSWIKQNVKSVTVFARLFLPHVSPSCRWSLLVILRCKTSSHQYSASPLCLSICFFQPIRRRNALKFLCHLTLNTPSMLALMLSQESLL